MSSVRTIFLLITGLAVVGLGAVIYYGITVADPLRATVYNPLLEKEITGQELPAGFVVGKLESEQPVCPDGRKAAGFCVGAPQSTCHWDCEY